MKIEIELTKESIIDSGSEYLKQTIRFLYKWLTTDGEALGYILGHIHFMLFVCLLFLVIISHTLYPSFWLQLGVFMIILMIWIQHIFLKVCISTVAEKDLTNNSAPFHELVETILNISTDDFINHLIVAETVALGCFALELVSRMSVFLNDWH
jgi:hypothetical protein